MEDAKSAGANSMGLNGVFFQEITEAMPVPPPIGEDQADSEPQSFGASDSGLNKVMQKTLDTFISGVDIDLMHPIFNDSIVVNSQSSDEPIMEEESPEEEEREDTARQATALRSGVRSPRKTARSFRVEASPSFFRTSFLTPSRQLGQGWTLERRTCLLLRHSLSWKPRKPRARGGRTNRARPRPKGVAASSSLPPDLKTESRARRGLRRSQSRQRRRRWQGRGR